MAMSETNRTTTVKLIDPENPVWCKNRGHISCISRVCSNNSDWLPWQQGSVWGKLI